MILTNKKAFVVAQKLYSVNWWIMTFTLPHQVHSTDITILIVLLWFSIVH